MFRDCSFPILSRSTPCTENEGGTSARTDGEIAINIQTATKENFRIDCSLTRYSTESFEKKPNVMPVLFALVAVPPTSLEHKLKLSCVPLPGAVALPPPHEVHTAAGGDDVTVGCP